MPILMKNDLVNQIPIQRKRDIIKYGNGVKGSALYLPRSRRIPDSAVGLMSSANGEGIADIIGFITRNADTIKNVGSVVGNVVGALGKVGTTTIDIVKKARELNRQGIENKALEKVVEAKKVEESQPVQTAKTGSGFYYLN